METQMPARAHLATFPAAQARFHLAELMARGLITRNQLDVTLRAIDPTEAGDVTIDQRTPKSVLYVRTPSRAFQVNNRAKLQLMTE